MLWQMVKNDLESTIKHVCKKVLWDRSVSEATRARRAEALLLLGGQYCTRNVVEREAVQEFLERMGAQTGLFGESATAAAAEAKAEAETYSEDQGDGQFSPFASSAVNEQHAGGAASTGGKDLSGEELCELVSRVEAMSVKDLKYHIHRLGGDSSDCVEKEDLRALLNSLLAQRLA